MDKKLCAVVIPVYKDHLDIYEELSYRQCLKILRVYPIYLVTYRQLDVSVYDRISNEYGKQIEKAYFSELFFKGVDAYNDLMMQRQFYKSFATYQYILIYQLDAFVFRDELSYWCGQGFDYIGAPIENPWFEKHKEKDSKRVVWRVGNGGFSLRKVEYFNKVLSRRLPLMKMKINNYFRFGELKKIAAILGWENTISYHVKSKGKMNEDVFYSVYLQDSYVPPQLPSVDTAALFAFEKSPSYMYKRNGQHLPFGCHAYLKYEYEQFWKKIIEHNETVNNNN
jgi:hypothetical protein